MTAEERLEVQNLALQVFFDGEKKGWNSMEVAFAQEIQRLRMELKEIRLQIDAERQEKKA